MREKNDKDKRVRIEFACSLFFREIKHNLLWQKRWRVSKEFLTHEI